MGGGGRGGGRRSPWYMGGPTGRERDRCWSLGRQAHTASSNLPSGDDRTYCCLQCVCRLGGSGSLHSLCVCMWSCSLHCLCLWGRDMDEDLGAGRGWSRDRKRLCGHPGPPVPPMHALWSPRSPCPSHAHPLLGDHKDESHWRVFTSISGDTLGQKRNGLKIVWFFCLCDVLRESAK